MLARLSGPAWRMAALPSRSNRSAMARRAVVKTSPPGPSGVTKTGGRSPAWPAGAFQEGGGGRGGGGGVAGGGGGGGPAGVGEGGPFAFPQGRVGVAGEPGWAPPHRHRHSELLTRARHDRDRAHGLAGRTGEGG